MNDLSRRKEWRKLLDDFISNEIVQVEEELAGDSPSSWPVFIKSYIDLEYGFEFGYRLQIRHGEIHDFRAIISCACTDSTRTNVYSSASPYTETKATLKASDNRGGLMFVIVPESIKDVHLMTLRVIPSIVRLEILNKGLSINRKALEGIQNFHLKPLFFDANWKSKLAFRRFATNLPKVPDKIIEGRPEIMNSVSSEETKPNGRLPIDLKAVAQDITTRLRVYLGNHTIRVCFKEGVSFTYELLYVFPRPLDPRMGEFHIISHSPSPNDIIYPNNANDYTTA